MQDQLSYANDHHSTLSKILPVTIKQTLLAAGTGNEFEVELHPSHLIKHYEDLVGLTGDLRLETNRADHSLNDEVMFLKTIPDDEILCSD